MLTEFQRNEVANHNVELLLLFSMLVLPAIPKSFLVLMENSYCTGPKNPLSTLHNLYINLHAKGERT